MKLKTLHHLYVAELKDLYSAEHQLLRVLPRMAKAATAPQLSKAFTVHLSNVTRELLAWLWPGRIPLGKLTLLAGDPGLGKSFVTLDMAARVSIGEA